MLAYQRVKGHFNHACYTKIIQRVSSAQAASVRLTPPARILKKQAQMAIEMEKQMTYYQLI